MVVTEIKSSPHPLTFSRSFAIASHDGLMLLFVCALALGTSLPVVSSSGVLPFNDTEYAIRLSRWATLQEGLVVADTAGLPSCNKDMRGTLPNCTQAGYMWCWAAAVASFAEHYTSTGPGGQCALECQVVSWCPKPAPGPSPHQCSSNHTQCCPLADHKACGGDGAYAGMIVEAATHFTGKVHRAVSYTHLTLPTKA